MNTSGVEQINSDKSDNQKVEWIRIVGSGTADTDLSHIIHIFSKEPDCQSHDIKPGSTSSFSSISSAPYDESNFEEHCSTDCNSENKFSLKGSKSNHCLDGKPQTLDEISNEYSDKMADLVTALEKNNSEGLASHTSSSHTQLVELLHGKHKRYVSLIKSRNLLRRFGSLDQEEKEFIKQVFDTSKNVTEDAKNPCIKTSAAA